MRPLIIIDATHLKGTYEGTNLLAVGMDGNNQIIPIATGVSQGETGPSWTWFLSKLKECIGEFEIYAPLNELSDWAIAKITKRRQKSVNWIVGAIDRYIVYHVDDRRRMHTVELYSGTCTCRKWKLSGLPRGHVLALVYPVGEVSSWQRPNYLQVVKTPLMDKKLVGRPKSKARIRSQGEEPVLVRCGRCGACGNNRNSCRETTPQKKAKTGYSQQEHYYSEQEHYYSQ
ncbi:transposase, MuDR, MULE transposase domain protein [Tanacetum coccineum]